jgi:hypothetical protein
MTSPRLTPEPSTRWLSRTVNRRFVGRAICAALFTLFCMAIVPLSQRLVMQQAERDPDSVAPATRAAIEKQQQTIGFLEAGIVVMAVFGFAAYEGGGFVMGLLVGMLDDSFAHRRTQPRSAVRDDSDL